MWRDGTGAPFAIVEAGDRAAPRGGRPASALTGIRRLSACGSRRRDAVVASGRGRSGRLADWTFATTAVIRIDCFIMVGNEPSERMVERAGFQREGVLRAWDIHHGGVPVDCVVYSRLRTDE